jgi:prepilin-type N-terminal cleavage/methylation domain-containing protein
MYMRGATRTIHNQRGFTLVELLVVMLILGALASVVVLAITSFMGKGTAEVANTEVHNACVAISCCMVDAGVNRLDADAPVNWDGSEGVVTATSDRGVVYDAANSLRSKRLKATYQVTPDGEITGVAAQEWSGVTFENGSWKKNK